MRMVCGCVALLPVVTSSVLLRPAPDAVRLHPSGVPAPDVPRRRPDAPGSPWGGVPTDDGVVRQYLLGGTPREPDGARHNSLDAYGRGGGGDALCWYHMTPEPTLCPSRLFQVLVQHLAGVPRPPQMPAWTTPTAHGLPSTLQWLKRPPSKRYLGIELPDYIATSYSSVKTDNAHYLTKLHQLKQRMRNAGK